jgi:NhaP-type Na+/H+ or K+/H+ antiporter
MVDSSDVAPHACGCCDEEPTMDAAAVTVVTLLVFAWGLLSARLGRADLSAPIVFVVAGYLLAEGLHIIEADVSHEVIKVLAEVTLVWVLFADAARVRLRDLRSDVGIYARLLAIGLPLTMIGGALLAWLMFDGIGFWLALLVGAALAPTDAALGAAVMSDPAVPVRIRRVLNVESGLNDGIATPVVMVAVAGAATADSIAGAQGPSGALLDLAIGLGVGIGLGVVGGKALSFARHRDWASEGFTGPGVLALAAAAYAAALWLDGNGFVAAFVGGLAFGTSAGRGEPKEVFYVEQTAGLASLLTWLLFGAVALPEVIDQTDWRVILYAVLSLTLLRMLPVGLALIGARMDLRTVWFIGWFGPRGLASIIFGLIALEELHGEAEPALAVIGVTVLLSVVAHGVTAKPLAATYGATVGEPDEAAEEGPTLPVRGLVARDLRRG